MSLPADSSTPNPARSIEGVLCIVVSMLLFVGQDMMMKYLLGPYPVWMLIFTRSVVTLLVLTPIILHLGAPHRLFTPLWPWHLLRAALFGSGFSLFYAAFPYMGLAEVSTIFFAAPLITSLLATVFLGEKIGLHRGIALVAGFVGVVIAMQPTSDAFRWVAILPFICAVTYAISQIIMRKIGDRESTLTVGLYTIVFAGILIAPGGWLVNQVIEVGPGMEHLRTDWPVPPLSHVPLLALLGLTGMVAYMLLSRAYQVASATLVAPFDYTYLPFATVLAYFFWNEVPTVSTLAGMALIVASGLYIGYRELLQPRPEGAPLPTADAAFAPGNPMAPIALASDDETT